MIQNVKILRYGASGRIAKIAQRAIEASFSKPDFYTYQRGGGYLQDLTNNYYDDLESCANSWGNCEIIVIDTSIDHTNVVSLNAHESFKRQEVLWLSNKGILQKIIGFSSGITLIDLNRISPEATQMLAYRSEKIIQEEYFSKLKCQLFLPNIFTLIGPITYSRQATAWAQVLKARFKSETNFKINQPYSNRLWVSEHLLFISLVDFLKSKRQLNVTGPLVEGTFNLDEISTTNFEIEAPPLKYLQGNNSEWLLGDYTIENLKFSVLKNSLNSALLKSLNY